jgi:regulator of protease activity HflC (stomatin/prohibitin superfamily)
MASPSRDRWELHHDNNLTINNSKRVGGETMIFQKVVVAQNERGLVLKDKSVINVLEPGVYRLTHWGAKVVLVSADEAEVKNSLVLSMVDSKSKSEQALRDEYLRIVDLADYEVALVYQRKALKRVLRSGQRTVFWADAPELNIQKIDTRDNYVVEPSLVNVLARGPGILGSADTVYAVEVGAKQLGMLWVDGALVDTLDAGLYAYWRVNRNIKVEQAELRLQNIEVTGQEILTKDRVSLRINLSASYQMIDPVRARLQLKDYEDYLYRELQFVLREAVGTRSLDALLAEKEALNSELYRALVKGLAEYGIKLSSLGVKDIILPGEMKDILNQVVQTEKAAQANVIKRREETAATRSLLNTAKLMEENPTLLRLKELEALEKVVEKVDRISVFDGLDGLMKDTVKLQV